MSFHVTHSFVLDSNGYFNSSAKSAVSKASEQSSESKPRSTESSSVDSLTDSYKSYLAASETVLRPKGTVVPEAIKQYDVQMQKSMYASEVAKRVKAMAKKPSSAVQSDTFGQYQSPNQKKSASKSASESASDSKVVQHDISTLFNQHPASADIKTYSDVSASAKPKSKSAKRSARSKAIEQHRQADIREMFDGPISQSPFSQSTIAKPSSASERPASSSELGPDDDISKIFNYDATDSDEDADHVGSEAAKDAELFKELDQGADSVLSSASSSDSAKQARASQTPSDIKHQLRQRTQARRPKAQPKPKPTAKPKSKDDDSIMSLFYKRPAGIPDQQSASSAPAPKPKAPQLTPEQRIENLPDHTIQDVMSLGFNHTIRYHRVLVTRVHGWHTYSTSEDTPVYTNLDFNDMTKPKGRIHSMTGLVFRTFKVSNGAKHSIRVVTKSRRGDHLFYLPVDPDYLTSGFVTAQDLAKPYMVVVAKQPLYVFKDRELKHKFIKVFKDNAIRIKQVIPLGARYNYQTKLKTANNHYMLGAKQYLKVVQKKPIM